ncbi:SDR family NAD(P)-dependent oxidoreductase [Christensenella intestinihominis]|uniref:SDR family NAD(P)-dependent oxidoreductase n=1 Tax=Christensenella intestinihominis TaxID=1851429 RepID=UPI00082AB932|nr:SDR family NAD(P)-dependent oxidoreductase [Christensenella intestinihominis]
MEFNDKKIVITGASSGIGFELLKRLAAVPGTQVAGVARHTDAISGLGLANVTALAYDMSGPGQIDEMLAEAMRLLGRIDVFFANAGFAYYGEAAQEDWTKAQDIFAVNTFAPIYTLQKLVALQKGAPFHYVVTDSALAKAAIPGFAYYSATKYALDGFFEAYRYEQPDNITLSVVYPVATKTNFFKRAAGGAPLPFPTQTPEKVARAVIKGVRREKRKIYPFASFGFFNWLWNFLPFLKTGYLALENNKFQKWRKRQENKT